MRHQDDHEQPDRVLYQPPVDQHLGRVLVEYLVVDVEQGDHPQIEHGQAHVHAEHVVQGVCRLAGQPVLDPEHLHHVGGHRSVGRERLRCVETFTERTMVVPRAVRVLLVQRPQVIVNAAEPDVRDEALRDELRLHAAQAQVLHVQEQVVEQLPDGRAVREQAAQPSRVDGHCQSQAHGDDSHREPPARVQFGRRRRSVRLERVYGRLVPRCVPVAPVQDGAPVHVQ